MTKIVKNANTKPTCHQKPKCISAMKLKMVFNLSMRASAINKLLRCGAIFTAEQRSNSRSLHPVCMFLAFGISGQFEISACISGQMIRN